MLGDLSETDVKELSEKRSEVRLQRASQLLKLTLNLVKFYDISFRVFHLKD